MRIQIIALPVLAALVAAVFSFGGFGKSTCLSPEEVSSLSNLISASYAQGGFELPVRNVVTSTENTSSTMAPDCAGGQQLGYQCGAWVAHYCPCPWWQIGCSLARPPVIGCLTGTPIDQCGTTGSCLGICCVNSTSNICDECG